MTRIVALANQKGGVGKTTTAINLGASLAACERRVLIVDLDPQANATSGIGLSKNETKSMYPVLVDNLPLREIIRPTELPTLFLAPSSVDLVGAELDLSEAEHREYKLSIALKDAVSDFDYELKMAQMNVGLSGVETLFMPTNPLYSFIASSLVKQVAKLGGDVSSYVPKVVESRLAAKLGKA